MTHRLLAAIGILFALSTMTLSASTAHAQRESAVRLERFSGKFTASTADLAVRHSCAENQRGDDVPLFSLAETDARLSDGEDVSFDFLAGGAATPSSKTPRSGAIGIGRMFETSLKSVSYSSASFGLQWFAPTNQLGQVLLPLEVAGGVSIQPTDLLKVTAEAGLMGPVTVGGGEFNPTVQLWPEARVELSYRF